MLFFHYTIIKPQSNSQYLHPFNKFSVDRNWLEVRIVKNIFQVSKGLYILYSSSNISSSSESTQNVI